MKLRKERRTLPTKKTKMKKKMTKRKTAVGAARKSAQPRK